MEEEDRNNGVDPGANPSILGKRLALELSPNVPNITGAGILNSDGNVI